MPLLMIHGSGGGRDQGSAWARPLAQQGVRVIAMSHFGEYTANRIHGAKFLGFDDGGHLLVGHDAAVQTEVLALLGRLPDRMTQR